MSVSLGEPPIHVKWELPRDLDIFWSDGGDAVGGFCGAVNGFDEGDAAAAFEAIASRRAVLPDGLEEIFEDGLRAAEIGDRGGRGAFVFGERGGVRGRP